ncbi:MAG: DUF1517 domain-containing protein [Cyanobacteria bacterium]|uniref:DUF1517 domain-containing protein n=1 Tax=Geminocystis sp. TaxID=2664100 RepID=UPI001DD6D653|nr:DUF1517 domain-containing protein [Cyanobacteria bacterium CG_2015-16_32_12]NCO76893.1 DUF1517 domain-containing protein [Cyanobacteria bacterium CG_2015-22_32_23]NCQ03474.1 DUF1517 domain-containing protein [Cyanobacteria bacterium CG_2015-09_32_10]NCQ41037.1 DUF1517 domain-containing protein [Cyanobacteria bacterium CG_2015-04_32_10]NCS84835.1 DUF1517 domain-containing protein [Cyanobacteria bacterium CG_2015-02_32_10]
MMSITDRFNQFVGKTRYVVSRIFIHLQGNEVAPLLGILNQNARMAVDTDGDMEVMGECLVNTCEGILQYKTYWQSASNEGDVFWNEADAGDFVTELFTDSGQRYLSQPDFEEEEVAENTPLSLPVTDNIIVMIIVAFEGELSELETDLADMEALTDALKALINLNYKQNYRAIAIHFSPARLGERLTSDQIIINFPELIPL